MSSIGIYYGDEEWVLKGIGQDLAKALHFGYGQRIQIETTDQVFKQKRLSTDFHFFVQQGQLNINCSNNPELVPSGAICLFTHLDVKNFKPQILSRCHKVIFNSSIQLSQAIANGYDPKNALLQPHAVDPGLHKILSLEDKKMSSVVDAFRRRAMPHSLYNCVGFCGRYWEKITYVRRKNYNLIKGVIGRLIKAEIPVVVIGPGWKDFLDIRSDFLAVVETKYKNYPYYYNLMKVFASLSIHEGGPLPLLESMCCGAYPVVTNTGFSSDVLLERKHGRVMSPFAGKDSFVDAIVDSYGQSSIDRLMLRNQASRFSFSSLADLVFRQMEPC